MDVKRISSRNLGRDDRWVQDGGLGFHDHTALKVTKSIHRCIGDHGRESRFPFLDEDVVAYLQQLRIDQKASAQWLYVLVRFHVCICTW